MDIQPKVGQILAAPALILAIRVGISSNCPRLYFIYFSLRLVTAPIFYLSKALAQPSSPLMILAALAAIFPSTPSPADFSSNLSTQNAHLSLL